VVHHGGFGTTAAGLQAGIPALVIPHLADQFYWGQRVYELGVGPQPIRRTRLEVEGLTVALNELVGNETLRSTASRLGEEIRTERGVEDAVHLIEERFCMEIS
jgi:sterol 3beta-glucosyltransferase